MRAVERLAQHAEIVVTLMNIPNILKILKILNILKIRNILKMLNILKIPNILKILNILNILKILKILNTLYNIQCILIRWCTTLSNRRTTGRRIGSSRRTANNQLWGEGARLNSLKVLFRVKYLTFRNSGRV